MSNDLRGRPLGEILVQTHRLRTEDLQAALWRQAQRGGRLGDILLEMKALTESDLLGARALQLGLHEAADTTDSAAKLAATRRDGDRLPAAPLVLDEDDAVDDETGGPGSAPLIRVFNELLRRAVRERASDIHLEPGDEGVTARYRVDGTLQEVARLPRELRRGLVSRVKVLAELDLAESRVPQEGRIRLRLEGREVEVHVSIVPAAHGERIVLRLLDRSSAALSLDELGMAEDQRQQLASLLGRPQGLLLVAGPTGSGKTTTLYAALAALNRPGVNILTLEDPVEHPLSGIGQVPINPRVGLTFASGLRCFLRQDPDVIMVGELRDRETAELAVQASLTGHQVLSTLHAADAAGAITRLLDLGLEPPLVAGCLKGVLAQRLVRELCPTCRMPDSPRREEWAELGLLAPEPWAARQAEVHRPGQCEDCQHTGYLGRTGLFELLVIDHDLRALLLAKADTRSIRGQARARGMRTLRAHGGEKAIAGSTSLDEVQRATPKD